MVEVVRLVETMSAVNMSVSSRDRRRSSHTLKLYKCSVQLGCK